MVVKLFLFGVAAIELLLLILFVCYICLEYLGLFNEPWLTEVTGEAGATAKAADGALGSGELNVAEVVGVVVVVAG